MTRRGRKQDGLPTRGLAQTDATGELAQEDHRMWNPPSKVTAVSTAALPAVRNKKTPFLSTPWNYPTQIARPTENSDNPTRSTSPTMRNGPFAQNPHGPRGRRHHGSGMRRATRLENDRLWDPSKGVRGTPSPTLSQTQPLTTTKNTPPPPAGNKETNTTISSPRLSAAACVKLSKQTVYRVTDVFDPESFDRGGNLQVSYAAVNDSTHPAGKVGINTHNADNGNFTGSPLTGPKRRNRRTPRSSQRKERNIGRLQHSNVPHPDQIDDEYDDRDYRPRPPSFALQRYLSDQSDGIFDILHHGVEPFTAPTEPENEDNAAGGDDIDLGKGFDRLMAKFTTWSFFDGSQTIWAPQQDMADNNLAGFGAQFDENESRLATNRPVD